MLRRVLSGVERSYLIRSWIIGICFLALMIFASTQGKNSFPIPAILYFIVCTILFPFSKLVWDELKALMMGNNIIFMNILILYPLKLFINALLWSFAPFIAVLGIGYIWFRTREV